MNIKVKDIWEGYKNGTVAGIMRLVLTITIPVVGFLAWQLGADVRQRFLEIGQDIRFLRDNIVIEKTFTDFQKEVYDDLKVCNSYMVKNSYRWELLEKKGYLGHQKQEPHVEKT